MCDEDDAYTSPPAFFETENNSPDSQLSESSNGISSQSSSSSSGYKRIHKPEPDEKAKQQVGMLMGQNSNRLKFLPKEIIKGKKHAGIWDKFKEATIDGSRVGIFKCDGCTSLFIYKPSTGTTSMNSHVCNGRNLKSDKKTNKSMDSFVLKTVPQETLREFNRNITIGLAIDLQPLSRVERKGFMHIAQSLINLGAKYGAQRASEVVQHRTTLQRYRLPEICEDIHGEIKKTIEKIHASSLAFTSDMWTEKYHSQGVLSLSVHFVDENWILQKKLLGMERYDETKTTVNIRTDCAKILHKYFDDVGVDNVFKKSTVVTDGEASIKRVFDNREPCHCHNINLCCEWTFSDREPIDPEKIEKRAKSGKPYHPKRLFNLPRDCPQIDATIKAVKALVTFFKQSHLNSKLSTTLKQEVSTRFNSLLFVLSSYEKTTTINLVALHYYQLEKHVQPNENDCEEMKISRRQAAHCVKEYCKPTLFHYTVCMLDPRSLKFASDRDRKDAIGYLKKLMVEEEGQSQLLEEINLPAQVEIQESIRKSAFADLEDEQTELSESSELDRYLTFRLPERKPDEIFDMLAFWMKSTEFSVIKKIAMRVLNIPASEITEERVFSGAGYAMSPRKTLLVIETLSDTIFVQQNFKF